MPKLSDLMPMPALEAAVEEGLVRVQTHPTLPLRIFNYTEQAVYSRTWTEVTLQCRGLIADGDGEVVARPWRKFFNHGEHEADSLDLGAPVEVTDKADGSLGILYPVPGGHAIATRGSFASEQARHATALYEERYAERWKPHQDWTYLFEIVYPANRIVLDYAGLDDLILLGGVHLPSGEPVGPRGIVQVEGWPGPTIDVHPHLSLADALAAEPRPNAEGLVVRYLNGEQAGTMVKIKQETYLRLHKLIFGLNERVVWEKIGAGETAASICVDLPDEFHDWVRQVANRLLAEQVRILETAQKVHAEIQADPSVVDRKTYAALASRSESRPWLFMLLDGKDPSAKIWTILRPSFPRPLVSYSEDVA